ncbi:MAG: GNAT family N-acetyltransferase [Lachnospiraceae bacterium]|nr:GNAT family N-acetyltransferase [Lachnospiraceae bacterium]
MITFATAEMVKDLKAIWKECFHDEDSYISFYFENRFEPDNTLVWSEEGVPQAMLTLLPAAVLMADGVKPVRYVYAVATREAMRGRGIAGALLKYAAEYMEKQGTGLILVPASRTLFDYYARQGYEATVGMRTAEWTLDEVKGMEEKTDVGLQAASLDEKKAEENGLGKVWTMRALHKEDAPLYKEIRDNAFLGQAGYIIWPEDAIAYAISENEFVGGFTHLIEIAGRKELVMGYEMDGILVLKETTIQDEILYSILKDMMEARKCYKCKVRGLTDSTIFGEKIDFAMTKNLGHFHKGYFNLCLD